MGRERNPVSKTLRTLELILDSDQSAIGVRELAAIMDVSPSSAHRILNGLVDEGYVSRDPNTHRYSIGVGYLRLAHLAIERTPIRNMGIQAMRHLVDVCNETALLGLYDPMRMEMMFGASVESTHPLRYAVTLNKWAPVHTGASGLAIMAFLPEDDIEAIVRRTQLAPLTANSITEPYKLEAELAEVRKQGYAFSRGQRIAGAVGIAAPIFSSAETVVGDVCLTIPEQRFDEVGHSRLVDELLGTASEVSEAIGGTPQVRGGDSIKIKSAS